MSEGSMWAYEYYSNRKIVPYVWGPIYKISEYIVRSTYDSDLKSAKISFMNIVS